jgi:hypothetical protein
VITSEEVPPQPVRAPKPSNPRDIINVKAKALNEQVSLLPREHLIFTDIALLPSVDGMRNVVVRSVNSGHQGVKSPRCSLPPSLKMGQNLGIGELAISYRFGHRFLSRLP